LHIERLQGFFGFITHQNLYFIKSLNQKYFLSILDFSLKASKFKITSYKNSQSEVFMVTLSSIYTKIRLTVLILFTLLLISPLSLAASKVIPIDDIYFTVNASMMDNLNALTGKKVSVTLDGGKTLTGRIKSVGAQLLHLEKIERKEFFDSLIHIEKIQAIDIQFRKYQR